MRLHTVVLVVMLALAILSTPLAPTAQPSAKLPRIGYLGDTPGPFTEAFRHGLRALGYVEGQNISIAYRWAEGQADRLRDLAAEFAQLKLDVIVTAGTPASRAAKHATSTIPIVMAHVGDPVGVGLVASLARPGGNLTGVSLLHPELSEKQLALLKEALPQVSRIAILWNAANPANARALQGIQVAAQGVGVRLHAIDVQHVQDLESAFADITMESAEALIVNQAPYFFAHLARIVDLVAKSRLPAMYLYREWVDAGGLMAYGPSLLDVYRRVVALVDQILKGAKPADLPVEQAMRFELVINLKTAKALGLTIPPTLLFQANEVIQ